MERDYNFFNTLFCCIEWEGRAGPCLHARAVAALLGPDFSSPAGAEPYHQLADIRFTGEPISIVNPENKLLVSVSEYGSTAMFQGRVFVTADRHKTLSVLEVQPEDK